MKYAFHFYDALTGLFTGQSFGCSGAPGWQELADANTPPGCAGYLGEVDYLSQRVDLDTGELVDPMDAPRGRGSPHRERDPERRLRARRCPRAQRRARGE